MQETEGIEAALQAMDRAGVDHAMIFIGDIAGATEACIKAISTNQSGVVSMSAQMQTSVVCRFPPMRTS